MSNRHSQNPLIKQIEQACKNTSVSPREILRELTPDDISMLKSGDLTIDYLISLASDLHEEKKLFGTDTDNIDMANDYSDPSQDESTSL